MTRRFRGARSTMALVGLALGTGLLGACHLIAYGDVREQKAAGGQPCADANECRTGFCVDGVCCQQPCTAACMTCGLSNAGECRPEPVGPDPGDDCAGQCNGTGVYILGDLVGVATIGDGTTQHVNALAVDDQDNVIVGGTYLGTLQLGAVKPPSTTQATPFVATFSTNGVPSSSLYTTDLLGPLVSVDAFSVGATTAGEIVVAGSANNGDVDAWLHVPERWSGPVTLGGPGTQVGLRAVGHPGGVAVLGRYGPGNALIATTSLPEFGEAAFIALLDDDGAVTGALGLGGMVRIGPGGIAVDDAGNVYVAGRYEGALESNLGTLLPPPLQITVPGKGSLEGSDATGPSVIGSPVGVFALQLAPDLSVTWAQRLVGTPASGKPLPVISPLGTPRIAVVWNDEVSLGARLVALDGADGAPLWSETLAATIEDLDGDAAGPVLAGSIEQHAIAFAGGELPLLGSGDTAIVAAYDENGGQRWGRSLAPGQARAVAVDTQGHVVVGGSYSGVFDLGVGTASSTADEDGFLAELNAEGQALWQQSLGSREPQQVRAMVPFQDDMIVAGTFANAMTAGSQPLTGGDDAFVARWQQDFDTEWLVHVSGDGQQAVAGVTEGLVVGDNRRIYAAICADEQVVVGTELLATEPGITVFDLDGQGTYGGNRHTIAGDCDGPVSMVTFDSQLYVAGNLTELQFDPKGFLRWLNPEPMEELSSITLDARRVTGLAVNINEIVVVGDRQDQGEGYVASFGKSSLLPLVEVRFPGSKVLVDRLDETRVAVVMVSGEPVSLPELPTIVPGSLSDGILAVFDTPNLTAVSVTNLGPMSPNAVEVDSDGNVVIAGELTEPVVWNGQSLVPDGEDGFVIKVATNGTILGFQHVTGVGNSTLAALARGDGGVVFAGGFFEGSLLVGGAGPVYGSGIDGLMVGMGR